MVTASITLLCVGIALATYVALAKSSVERRVYSFGEDQSAAVFYAVYRLFATHFAAYAAIACFVVAAILCGISLLF